MKLVDAHCHLDFEVFDDDREQVMQRARQAGIECIIIPGVSSDNWNTIDALCDTHNNLSACFGLHPYYVDSHQRKDIELLAQFIDTHDCVAVGECGLDFRKGQADKKLQQYYFEAQLELAEQIDKPVVIHSVRATQQVIDTLKRFPSLRGMVHSYSGSTEQASQLIDMGYYLSFGGAVTYERATRLRDMFRQVPLDAMLLETDAPDQPDTLHQHERNEPAYLTSIIEVFAELRDETKDVIAEQTSNNAARLFRLRTDIK